MEVIVGSYEEILLGYRLVQISDEEYQLEPSFTDHTHSGCIKAVAVSKKGILASGGTDETIQLFNLKNRRQLGCLVHHSGSITCLEFYKSTHMFSCSEDGTLCIWKFFTWECLKTLRGHQGAVNHLAVHPSGKLALTVGRDKTLRTWNLITGRSAYVTNIKKVADMVFWSPDGVYYVTLFSNSIDVFVMETATVHASWTTEKRINSLIFINNEVIAYGGEEGVIFFHNIVSNKVLGVLETNTNRIRGLVVTPTPPELSDSEDSCVLCSASSDGHIKVYCVKASKGNLTHRLLASTNTEFRLTSVAIRSPHNSHEKEGDLVTNTVEVKETEKMNEEISDTASPQVKEKKKKRKLKEDSGSLGEKDGEMRIKSEDPKHSRPGSEDADEDVHIQGKREKKVRIKNSKSDIQGTSQSASKSKKSRKTKSKT